MSFIISELSECSKYNQTLNTSLTIDDLEYNLKEDVFSNSIKDINKYNIGEFKDLINNKAIDFFTENKEYLSEIIKKDETLENLASNISKSISNYDNFIEFCSNINFIIEFKPEIEFDYDGELSFEWYGRKGARANLTFGKNGELYFVSLFHGESQKAKHFLNENSIQKINDELLRIYKDTDS